MRNFILFIAAAVAGVSAQAQTDVSNETDTNSVEPQRPDMPNLFFRKEQRRVLEAVREGVVQEEDFDIEEFVPVVIVEEELPIQLEESVGARSRAEQIYFDAYIVNRKTGDRTLWLNGKELSMADKNSYLARQGIEVSELENEYEGSVLSGNDLYSNSQFKVHVGQVIDVDGSIEETLPIILKTR